MFLRTDKGSWIASENINRLFIDINQSIPGWYVVTEMINKEYYVISKSFTKAEDAQNYLDDLILNGQKFRIPEPIEKQRCAEGICKNDAINGLLLCPTHQYSHRLND